MHRSSVSVILLVSLSFAGAIEKFWLPDLEWHTASNWLENHVPDVDSRVVFPLNTRHAIDIVQSKDLKFSEIDLARTGSLVLPKNGRFALTGAKPSEVSTWKWAGHFFWADPRNWNGTSDAAPDLERVPCRQDDAVLPESQRVFTILLPMSNVEVRSVRIADDKFPLTSWQWNGFQRRREFGRGRYTVKYSEYSCEECRCQEDARGDYLEEICAIQRARCGLPACEYPLAVEGHCCYYCGGRVTVSKNASLALVRTLTSEALEGLEDRISWYLRRTWTGTAEVLLKERDAYGGLSTVEAVESVKAVLLRAGVEVSSTETAGAAMQDSRLAVALSPLFGAPLVVLFLLLSAFLYFGYSCRHIVAGCQDMFASVSEGRRVEKPQPGKPFGFARFENVPEGAVRLAEAELMNDDTRHDDDEDGDASGGRFENPLYRSKRKKAADEKTEMLDMETPLSLSALKERASDPVDEVEMNIDQ